LKIKNKVSLKIQHQKGYTRILIFGPGFFNKHPVHEENLIIYEDPGTVQVRTGESSVRFLLVSGKPIGEPVAWYGPIVMNTQEELDLAFSEYRNGNFIKSRS